MPEHPSAPAPHSAQPVQDYHFRRQGRSVALGLALSAWLTALLALWHFAQASPWLIGLLALPVIPGIADLVKNPACGLSLTAGQLQWFSGSAHSEVPLEQIARLRLDTRLDLSIRARAVLRDGRSLRIAQPAVPPAAELTRALEQCDIPVERHHFSLF